MDENVKEMEVIFYGSDKIWWHLNECDNIKEFSYIWISGEIVRREFLSNQYFQQ